MPDFPMLLPQRTLYAQANTVRGGDAPSKKPAEKNRDVIDRTLDLLPDKMPWGEWLAEHKLVVGVGLSASLWLLTRTAVKSGDENSSANRKIANFEAGRTALAQQYASMSDANPAAYEGTIKQLETEINGAPTELRTLNSELTAAKMRAKLALLTKDKADDIAAAADIKCIEEAIQTLTNRLPDAKNELGILKAKHGNALGNEKTLKALEKAVEDAATAKNKAVGDAAPAAIATYNQKVEALDQFRKDMASGAAMSAQYSKPVSTSWMHTKHVLKGCLTKLVLLAGAAYGVYWVSQNVDKIQGWVLGLFGDDNPQEQKKAPKRKLGTPPGGR